MKSHASVVEVNFDCLVGPTHHFGGLSAGNLASTINKSRRSNPQKAALEGLKKMRFLRDLGFVQAVLPPHPRPHMASLTNLGFVGQDHEIVRAASQTMPAVFSSFCSSSAMWAANAATISPSADTADGKVHITPANLVTMLHRSIEPAFTTRVLRAIFADRQHFVVHEPLLAHDAFSDEGAANHNRLTKSHSDKGLEIFVYGKVSSSSSAQTNIFPTRQSKLANQAIMMRHGLSENYTLNIAQNPAAIDAGAFHNDVVCVVNEQVMLCHEWAFMDQAAVLNSIHERFYQLYGQPPVVIEVSNQELPIQDAVASYLFNSQLLSKPDGTMLLFAPMDCTLNQKAQAVITSLLNANNPINEVAYFDVSESMANGGGPACLRLRVALNPKELSALNQSVLLDDRLYDELEHIIATYYVDDLTLEHLFEPSFLQKSKQALAAITNALGLSNLIANTRE